MWLIAGLGNPGIKYAKTRHNAGFMLIDKLHKFGNIDPFIKKFSDLYATGLIEMSTIYLLKPQTFMNYSGNSIQKAIKFKKFLLKNIIIVHDDMDIDFGIVRIKKYGGHGGHNGLRNIIDNIGPNFIRVRLGIGRSKFKVNEKNYVLKNFNKTNQALLEKQLLYACKAILIIIKKGVDSAQRKFNKKI